jgi:cyclase
VVVAIAARRRDGGWEVTTHGGRRPVDLDAVAWATEAARLGAGEILLTSMDRDGTKRGFDLDLLAAVTAAVNVPVVASGGAGNAQHMADAVTRGGASAVLAASIFHVGELRIDDVKRTMAAADIPVRRRGAR